MSTSWFLKRITNTRKVPPVPNHAHTSSDYSVVILRFTLKSGDIRVQDIDVHNFVKSTSSTIIEWFIIVYANK